MEVFVVVLLDSVEVYVKLLHSVEVLVKLVQRRYHRDRTTPIYASFRSRPYTAALRQGSLMARTGKWGFCTDKGNTFLPSPYP